MIMHQDIDDARLGAILYALLQRSGGSVTLQAHELPHAEHSMVVEINDDRTEMRVSISAHGPMQ